MQDAKCTCGKWLLMTLQERRRTVHMECGCTHGERLLTLRRRRRTMHSGCGVHSRRVTFDAGGAKKNNVECICGKWLFKSRFGSVRNNALRVQRGTCGKWLFDGVLVRIGEYDSLGVLPRA